MIDEFDPGFGRIKIYKRISMQDRYLTPGGAEIPDPRPAAPALGRKPEMNIRDYIKTLVHNERLQAEIDAAGHETFEEANDFEVGDDYFPDSQYENDLEPSVAELVREGYCVSVGKKREQLKNASMTKKWPGELPDGQSWMRGSLPFTAQRNRHAGPVGPCRRARRVD